MNLLRSLIFLLISVNSIYSQEASSNDLDKLEDYFVSIEKLDIERTEFIIEEIQNFSLKKKLLIYHSIRETNGFKNHNKHNILNGLSLTNSPNLDNLINYLIHTEHELYHNNDRIKSFNFARRGYELSESMSNDFLQTQFILKILEIFKLGVVLADRNVNFYLEKLYELNKESEVYKFKYLSNKIYLNQQGLRRGDSKKKEEEVLLITQNSLHEIDIIANKFPQNDTFLIEYYHLKGLCQFPFGRFKESIKYFEKEKTLLQRKKSIFFNKYKYNNLKELARLYKILGRYKLAKINLDDSRNYESQLTINRNNFVYNSYVADIFYGLGEKDSAFIAMKKAMNSSYLYNAENQNKLISSLEVKNKTAEKERQILVSEQKRKQNRNLLIGSILIIILGGTIGSSMVTNSRRKRLLAIQEKELETQKNLTLLKEQEISTINAMVEGQEKERKRVAEDLHDNLGSVIATLKLHFDNLRINREKKKVDQEFLFEKTENLIDEAYKKVRSIAHAKNAGVIANNGLLVAVKLMAEKISSANSVQIDVIDYGLEKPIENSLEISVFRIIQELTTNIIKHANADHATINITQDEDEITILIEDNGVGLNTSTIDLKKGMGLHSIQTRVEHLEGNFTIDSTPTKGTTIIIHIPN